MQAETSYRKATVEDKISRARNSQSRPVVKYYPGDLVSYRRFQQPADARSHA